MICWGGMRNGFVGVAFVAMFVIVNESRTRVDGCSLHLIVMTRVDHKLVLLEAQLRVEIKYHRGIHAVATVASYPRRGVVQGIEVIDEDVQSTL